MTCECDSRHRYLYPVIEPDTNDQVSDPVGLHQSAYGHHNVHVYGMPRQDVYGMPRQGPVVQHQTTSVLGGTAGMAKASR